jgi:hypothetical protein
LLKLYFYNKAGQKISDLDSESSLEFSGETLDGNERLTTTTIEEIIKVKIKAKLFCKPETRIKKKAAKIDNLLKRLRPHVQHLIIYNWHNGRKRVFQTGNDKKTGGRVTVLPSLTTTKQKVGI